MKSDSVRTYVLIVLILQAASTAALWVLNVISVETTQEFELLMAANFIAFGMVLQVYRRPETVEGSKKDEAEQSKSSQAPAPPATPPQPANK